MRDRIKQILREESKTNIKVRRRTVHIDDEVEMAVRNFKDQFNTICIGEHNFIATIIELTLDAMYWTYFSDIDDNSDEWNEIYGQIENYINKKFVPKLKMDYHLNCGD